MQVKLLRVLSATVLILTLIPYTSRCEEIPKGFFEMPIKGQEAVFPTYDFETQYNIYLYSQRREPPELSLARVFATEGRQVFPQLRDKFDAASDDVTVRDILLVFVNMNDIGSYDVAGDQRLMSNLQVKVDGMQNSTWRQVCQTWIIRITSKRQN